MYYKNSSYDKLKDNYKKALSYRNNKYSSFNSDVNYSQKYNDIVDQINNNGYAILKKAIDKNLSEKILYKFEQCLKKGDYISPPRNLSKVSSTSDFRYAVVNRLTKNDLLEGVNSYRNKVDNVQMKDPLVNNKSIIELLLNDVFIKIAQQYLGVLPTIAYVKLVKSFANKIPLFDTQYFHIDSTAIKLLKVIIYLNNVNLDGGPFCYVKQSHKDSFMNWNTNPRWSDTEIEDKYGRENIIALTANVGDVIIADTTGFHKGMKPINNDRNILIITYSIHQDYTLNDKLDVTPKMKKNDYFSLPTRDRAILDLVELI